MVATSPFRRLILPLALVLGALLLFWTRPRLDTSSGNGEKPGATCLGNLSQISRAYAQYARDFDGKLPLAVDPEDRFNSQIWALAQTENSDYTGYLKNAPFLHAVLAPYVASPAIFHCPADVGWKESRLQINPNGDQNDGLTNVLPSSFAKYGTSYYSWTVYGFDQLTIADIPNPSGRALLFDGEMWHGINSNGQGDRAGELFLDGHVALLSQNQHRAAAPPEN